MSKHCWGTEYTSLKSFVMPRTPSVINIYSASGIQFRSLGEGLLGGTV